MKKLRPAGRRSSQESSQRTRLAADIGGTFTDIVAFDEKTGRLLLGKALSTPARLVDGISNGMEKAGARFADAEAFLHGSTIAINTMLERTGARTALLTTEGFRDVYEIGRINRPDAYNLYFRKHVPLIERALRFEVRERITAEGEIHVALDEASVHAACDRLEAEGVEAVAIMFLHSYVNPAHETRTREIVHERLPRAFVTASHELSREYREFERCSTVVANAYIGPVVSRYVRGIDERLKQSGFEGSFLLVQSTGGLYESHQARTQCVRMLESGPAAGVIGAQALCRELDLADAVAFDMGGTTAKAGVIYRGEALTTGAALIGGYAQALPVQIPMMDIFEVGTGGGSIAAVDSSGALKVGPKSAGANPGPACYALGGREATVTDANLVLGRLAAERFLSGEMKLDARAAERAIREHIAGPLGLDIIHASDGILRIAATAMSYAVKAVSTERGLDAAAFTLIAYGGAGPLHASAIAREIGMKQVIVPRAPGHFCAFGMLFSDLRYDFVRTWFTRLVDASFDAIERVYEPLIAEGKKALAAGGVRAGSVVAARAADMRYVGQEHPVTVDLPDVVFRRRNRDALKRRFDEEHLRRYGTCAPEENAEIVSLRASVTGAMKKPSLERIARSADMRYIGQEHPVTVDLPDVVFRRRNRDALKRRFDEEHLRRYGTCAPEENAEIVSLRASVTGAMKKPSLERIARGGRAPLSSAHRGKRKVYFAEPGRSLATQSYARESLRAGNRIEGPALVEEHASTTVVLPGDRLEVDAFGNLVIEVGRRTK